MKIAFVIPTNGISGGLYVVYRHAHYLMERGHQVELLVTSLDRGLEVTCFPDFKVPVRQYAEVVLSPDSEYDVVIGTWWESMYDAFLIPAKNYIHFCQSDERRFYSGGDRPSRVSFLNQLYWNPCYEIITEAKWIQRLYAEEFERSAELSPNGIDLNLFSPSRTPIEPKNPDKVRILIEGPGGVPYKRVGLTFQACAQIPNTEVWHVTTDGHLEASWKYDRLFSKVPLSEMGSIYTACDILVKLSVVEGVFGPPLEMMASGGTCVVSNVTGADEYAVDGYNALIVPMDNFEAARAAVLRLVQDPALRRKLSVGGLATAQELSWEKQLPHFEKAILNCVAKQPSLSKKLLSQVRHEANLYRLIHFGRDVTGLDSDGKSQVVRLDQYGLALRDLGDQVGKIRGDVIQLKERMDVLRNWKPYRAWKKLRSIFAH